jgi:hypothetical protein
MSIVTKDKVIKIFCITDDFWDRRILWGEVKMNFKKQEQNK